MVESLKRMIGVAETLCCLWLLYYVGSAILNWASVHQ